MQKILIPTFNDKEGLEKRPSLEQKKLERDAIDAFVKQEGTVKTPMRIPDACLMGYPKSRKRKMK